jgi:hypothetical protein
MSYLFLENSEELVDRLLTKYNRFNKYIVDNGLISRWRRSYEAYYGNYYNGSSSGLGTGGEQGEFQLINVNHLRNIVKHSMTLATQNRLVFDTVASNSDISSRNATVVANAVLDQYFYQMRYEKQTRACFEIERIFGTGFLWTYWDRNRKFVGVDGEGKPVYAGKPRFKAKAPMDVLVESFKDDWDDQNFVVVRDLVNKWDLIKLYPDLAEKIEALPRVKTLQYFMPYYETDEDTVWIYYAYHKSTPALIHGRETIFCDAGLLLEDHDNPYIGDDGEARLPVQCMRADVQYGGAFGHSMIQDLLGCQQALNILDSTILSNQSAFAGQNIAAPRMAGVNTTKLSGGLKLVEYDVVDGAPNGGQPMAMQLCATPNEVFRQREDYVTQMQLISGINSALRGAPSQTLVSGTAIALVASQANTYNSNVEHAYTALCEEAASFLLFLMKKFMRSEEILTIAGKANTYAVQTFTGEDLKLIDRVRIHAGNPLAKNLAGKLEIANNLLQAQMLKTPADYMEVIQTGTLTPILESATAQEAFIRMENEALSDGMEQRALAFDNHQLHISEHLILTFRPDIRANSDILALVLKHIEEHTDALESMALQNPMNLSIALQQPLQLPQPNPDSGFGGPAQGAPPGGEPPKAPPGADSSAASTLSTDGAADDATANVALAGLKRTENQAAKTIANNSPG